MSHRWMHLCGVICGMVACGLFFCLPPALGYTFFWDIRDGYVIRAHWPVGPPITYRIGLDGSEDIPGDREFEIVQEAFQVWDSRPELNIEFQYAGRSSATAPAVDGENTVIFADDTGGQFGILAKTVVTASYVTSGATPELQIFDADIVVYDTPQVVFLDGAWEDYDHVDLKGVLVHEIGHLLGLHHSMSREATMWYSTMPDQSTPDTDDIAGLSALYPAAGELIETATVEGRVTRRIDQNTVEPLFGGYVIAVDCRTGKLVAADMTRHQVAGGDWGNYSIRGLPPGPYVLYCEPATEEWLAWWGAYDYYHDLTLVGDFGPRCFGDGTSGVLAGEVVDVTAGETITGKDIEVVAIRDDPLEAGGNDTAGGAVEIASGSAVSSILTDRTDVDFYRFHAEPGDVVYLCVESTQAKNVPPEWGLEPHPVMTLYEADGVTPVLEGENVWFRDPFLRLYFHGPADYHVAIHDRRASNSNVNYVYADYVLMMYATHGTPSAVPRREWERYD